MKKLILSLLILSGLSVQAQDAQAHHYQNLVSAIENYSDDMLQVAEEYVSQYPEDNKGLKKRATALYLHYQKNPSALSYEAYQQAVNKINQAIEAYPSGEVYHKLVWLRADLGRKIVVMDNDLEESTVMAIAESSLRDYQFVEKNGIDILSTEYADLHKAKEKVQLKTLER